MQFIIAKARQSGIKLISAKSPLAGPSKGESALDGEIQVYPIHRYIAAFDGVITAAGYNSYHELMLDSNIPVLFLPVERIGLDDQVSRAQYATRQGLAFGMFDDNATAQADLFMKAVQGQRRFARNTSVQNGAEIAATAVRRTIEEFYGK
jgi:predicted glycosyltransferase